MATYWIKRPEKLSQSWQILKRVGTKAESVEHEALDAVNAQWYEGKLSFEQAEYRVLTLKDDLRKAAKVKLAEHTLVNLGHLKSYWAAEYATRILIDEKSMYNDLRRAIRAVEPLDLLTVSRNALQAKVNEILPNRGKHRRVASRLNQLLRYLGREIRVRGSKKGRNEIDYINETDFLEILPELPKKTQLFTAAMFYTGARPGEMFELFIKGPQVIHIPGQLDRKKAQRATKTGEPRDVLVEAEGWAYVEDFIKHRPAIARNYRHDKWKEKTGLVLYDLRHSYAIHMLNKGLSISDIALLLGDSIQVCQENYLGFVAKPEGIEAMRRKLEAQKAQPATEAKSVKGKKLAKTKRTSAA